MSLGQGASLDGFVPFPDSDPWRQDVSNAPVSSNSGATIAYLNQSYLHPDFGAGTDNGASIGIPYNVVSGTPNVNIDYVFNNTIIPAPLAQSDAGPMPVPASSEIEGFPNPGNSDRHVLVLDRDNCFLYELYHAYVQGNGTWQADSGAIWDLLNNNDRPIGWTSADAAGLPIFPGLARYDEVAAGAIHHALRFTVHNSRIGDIAPATHMAPTTSSPGAAVMGMRFRLKADYDTSKFGPQSQIILAALKRYGMIVADNGTNLYVSGTSDDRWDNNDLQTLALVPASAFEVVNAPGLAPKAVGPPPTIASFEASDSTITNGTAVTLTWNAPNSSYFVVTPSIGPVRGNSVTVKPTQTTTYTLYATNHYGQQIKTFTVNVGDTTTPTHGGGKPTPPPIGSPLPTPIIVTTPIPVAPPVAKPSH